MDAEAHSIAVELAPKTGFNDPAFVIPDKLPPAPGPNATEAEVRAYAQARDAVLKQRDDAATDWGHGEQQLDDIAESRRLVAAEADGKAAVLRARIDAESENIKALDERLAEVDSNRKRYEREATEERREFEALTQRGDTQGAANAHARAQRLDAQKDAWDKQWGELANRRGMASFKIGQDTENMREYQQIADDLRAKAKEAAGTADDFGKTANEYEKSADQLDTSNDVLQDVLGRDLPADTRVNRPGEDGMDVTVPADTPTTPTSGVSTSPGATETSGVSTSPGEPVGDLTPTDDGLEAEVASIEMATDGLMTDPEPQPEFVSVTPEPAEDTVVDDSVPAGGFDDGIA